MVVETVCFPPPIVQWEHGRESMIPIAETLRRERVSAHPDRGRGAKIAAYKVRFAATSGGGNQKLPRMRPICRQDARMMAFLLLARMKL